MLFKKCIRLTCALSASVMAVASVAALADTNVSPRKLVRAVVLNMGEDAPRITDSRYDHYFQQGSASAGVAAVIAAGQFSINGLTIPATEADFRQRTPNGYQVNKVSWLNYDVATQTWHGGYHGSKPAASYAAAALEVATGIVAGLELRLYDTNGDQFVDSIDADYKEGVQVQEIHHHADGSVSVLRGDTDTGHKVAEEGRGFDDNHFTATSGETIMPGHFDPALAPGDVALFWWGPDGWVMERAREVHGLFVDGSDHQSYVIDQTAYADAMRFSRDNLLISSRPGEFVNAQKFFGFNNNTQGLTVSLWLVPTTNPAAQGAPVGMTSGASARMFLTRAIARAQQWLASAQPSVDGTDVPASGKWVPTAQHDLLRQAIARAQRVLDSPASANALLDYQVYLLYLTLNGSADDIGAKFGNYRYSGFVHAIEGGKQAMAKH